MIKSISFKIFCALAALSLAATSHAAPAKTASRPKSNIDARGVAALDKAVAFYQKQRSFSLGATQKVIYDGKTKRASRLQINLQAPYRASLRTTFIDEQNQPIATDVVRLMDAKSLYLSQSGVWPSVSAIGGAREEREDGLKEVLGDMPGVALSVVVMALGYNPASDPEIKSVRYREIRENGKPLKSMSVTRKTAADATAALDALGVELLTNHIETCVIGSGDGKHHCAEPLSSEELIEEVRLSLKRFLK